MDEHRGRHGQGQVRRLQLERRSRRCTAQRPTCLRQFPLRPYGGTGTVHYRRAQEPEVFSTAWAYIDHLVIPPGASTGKRRHVNVEEVYYVMEGAGSVQVNNEQAAIRAGDAVPILLNDEQSFVNNTSEDLELLVIGVTRVKDVLDPAGF